VSDRLVRFPGLPWQEIKALPQPLRWTVQRTIFHLLDEPAPTLTWVARTPISRPSGCLIQRRTVAG
jgi:hypothetical protein